MFISPDGQWVGFFDGDAHKEGGDHRRVASDDQPRAARSVPRCHLGRRTGRSSSRHRQSATGLQRVSAAGRRAHRAHEARSRRGERDHCGPSSCPAARLFCSRSFRADGEHRERADCGAGSADDRRRRSCISGGSHAHYVPTGHLVYGVAGTLRAVAFDLERLAVVGAPAPVLDGVMTTGIGAADVAVAANGSLVYVPGGAGVGGHQTVVSVDRQGRAITAPRSPDGLLPRRAGVARRRLARARHRSAMSGSTISPVQREPADDRTCVGQPPALDARRPAHHLYVATSGLSGAVLAAGGWHRQRRAAPRRVRKIWSICAPTAGRADGRQLLFNEGAAQQSERDRADRHRAFLRLEGTLKSDA